MHVVHHQNIGLHYKIFVYLIIFFGGGYCIIMSFHNERHSGVSSQTQDATVSHHMHNAVS